MSVGALTSRGCGAPLVHGAAFCAYCRVPLTWSPTLDLAAGAPLALIHPGESPPSWTEVVGGADGLHVRFTERDRHRWQTVHGHLGNGCVAVRGVALDAFGELGAFIRWNAEGAVRTGYSFRVWPGLRSFCLARWVVGERESSATTVVDWTFSPLVPPPGQPLEAEVRFADEVFQFLVNGQRLGAALDAVFGFGEVAYYVGSCDGPAEVVVQSVSVRRVE